MTGTGSAQHGPAEAADCGRDPKQDANDAGAKQDLYSETEYPRVAGWSPLQALTDGRWMTIRAGAATEVYDLQNDPREEHDVAAPQHSIADAMADRAEAIHAQRARRRARHDFSRGAVNGFDPSAMSPLLSSDAPDSRAPNPAGRIAIWNEFEDALSAMSSHRPGAAATLRRLAAANPDAPVMQTTLRESVEGRGQVRRGIGRVSPGGETLADRRGAAPRSGGDRTRGRRRREPGRARPRCATRRCAPTRLRSRSNRTARPRSMASVCWRSTRERRIRRSKRSSGQRRSIRTTRGYWANLGNARRAAGDRAGAEQAYRRALAVDRAIGRSQPTGSRVLLVEAGRPGGCRAVARAGDCRRAGLRRGSAEPRHRFAGYGTRRSRRGRIPTGPRGSRQSPAKRTPPRSCSPRWERRGEIEAAHPFARCPLPCALSP